MPVQGHRKFGWPKGSFGGHSALGDSSVLLPIEIDQHRIQKPRALGDSGLDRSATPPRSRDSGKGSRIHGRSRPCGIGVDVVGDAVLDDHPPRQFGGATRRLRIILGNARRSASANGCECGPRHPTARRSGA